MKILMALVLATIPAGPAAASGKEATRSIERSTARVRFVLASDPAKTSSCSGALVEGGVLVTAASCWGTAKEPRRAVSVHFLRSLPREVAGFVLHESNDLALVAYAGKPFEEGKTVPRLETAFVIKPGTPLIVGGGGLWSAGSVDQERGLLSAGAEKDGCGADTAGPAYVTARSGVRLAGIAARPADQACKPSDAGVITLLGPHEAWLKAGAAGLRTTPVRTAVLDAKDLERPSGKDPKTFNGGSTWGGK